MECTLGKFEPELRRSLSVKLVKIDFEKNIYIFKVFVPLNNSGVKGWMFNFVCPGNAMSIFHEGLLLLKNATVNRNLGFDDVCKEKHVYAAYKNSNDFEVSKITGEMVKYPVQPFVHFLSIVHDIKTDCFI